MEILIIHPGGLGDIILSLPAVALIRKQFPSAGLTIAGNIDHLAVVGKGYAERIVALSTLPLHHLYVSGELPEEEVRFWKSYGRVISWTGSGDIEFAGKLKKIHSNVCIASWHPGPEESRHVSQLFVDSIGAEIRSGIRLPPIDIVPDQDARGQGARWLARHGWNGRERLIALHPGAGSKSKRWPVSRYMDLVQRVNSIRNIKLLIIEGPAEGGLAASIAEALPQNKFIIARSLPLDLLAPVIEQCGVFAGNDSGIAHLAAGLKVPSVVLFGPTLPQHWAPRGKHVIVLRDARGCEACASGHGDHSCLNNISVEEVISSMQIPGFEST